MAHHSSPLNHVSQSVPKFPRLGKGSDAPFYGKASFGSFLNAWADQDLLDRVHQSLIDPKSESHELPEYADRKYGWGVRLYGSSRDLPGLTVSHPAKERVPQAEPELQPGTVAPSFPGGAGFFSVKAFRRFGNQFDGEVFMTPEGSGFTLSAAVPGLRLFEDRFQSPTPSAFSLTAWAHGARPILEALVGENAGFRKEHIVLPFLPDSSVTDLLESDCNAYFVFTVIKSVSSLQFLGRRYWKLDVTLNDYTAEGDGVELPIYCLEENWQGKTPRAGERMSAAIWLLARFIPADDLDPIVPRDTRFQEVLSKANEGDVPSMLKAGEFYRSPAYRNGTEAVRWYREAAKRGSSKGYLGLADCGRENENWAEEEKYLTKAAEMNDPAALLRLAIETLEVPYDRRTHKAHMRKGTSLLLRAAELGEWEAYSHLVNIAMNGYWPESDASPVEIVQQYASALCRYRANPDAQIEVSLMLLECENPAFWKVGHKLAQIAFEKGDAITKLACASQFAAGLRRPVQPEKASEMVKEAAEVGTAIQKFIAAQILLKGMDGYAQDKEAACQIFEDAAMMGHADGAASYGWCLVKGIGTEPNAAAGLRWIRKAFDEHSAWAKFYYGALLYEGNVIPQDKEGAKRLLKETFEMVPETRVFLSDVYFNEGRFGEAIDARIAFYRANTGNAVAADIKKTVTEHREDISEAQLSEIEDFLEDQGIYGNKDAYLTLGDLYLSGIFKSRDRLGHALDNYKKAKELGSKEARLRIQEVRVLEQNRSKGHRKHKHKGKKRNHSADKSTNSPENVF